MKIDFRNIYEQISIQEVGTQKRLELPSSLGVFVGFNHEGNLRLSFLSSILPPKLESTKLLRVIQAIEKKNSFWLSFELLDADANEEFFTFCENMIEAILSIDDEKIALNKLKRRYHTWRFLFQKQNAQGISKETLQGIFGELYYLSESLIPKYGANRAISSWGGPDAQAKDFTIDDTWYELKTIGSTVDKIHISSLSQLDSHTIGHLIVIRVEAVSPEYEGDNCKLHNLITKILNSIDNDIVETAFVEKLNSMGINIFDCYKYQNFRVLSVSSYLVNDNFPRISQKDILHSEVIGVQYDLSLASLYNYKEK